MISILKKIISGPINLFKLIIIQVLSFKMNKSEFLENQTLRFTKLGLSRKLALEKLENIRKKYNIKISDMSSEHEVIFSALSLLDNFKVNKILEIGTFDAKNIKLLSYLFNKSQLVTIDLEEDDENFKNFYNRQEKDKLRKFVEQRDNILTSLKNVNFRKKNSLELLKENDKYDLIWIDGAHGYPFITIDIVNSLRILNANGYILCDDIYLEALNNSDKMYQSTGGYQTLNELEKNKVISFHLIHKRLTKKDLVIPSRRKFIAIIKKKY